MVYSEKQLEKIKACLPTRYSKILQQRLKKKYDIEKRTDVIRRALMPRFQDPVIVKEAQWLAQKHNPSLFKRLHNDNNG
jgi:hypothetical protein